MIDSVMAASGSRPPGLRNALTHHVPVPLSSLIGRSRELDGVSEMLRRTRLVTVTGPGGVGKTRLAIEAARRQIGRRPDGIWLVDLTEDSPFAAAADRIRRHNKSLYERWAADASIARQLVPEDEWRAFC